MGFTFSSFLFFLYSFSKFCVIFVVLTTNIVPPCSLRAGGVERSKFLPHGLLVHYVIAYKWLPPAPPHSVKYQYIYIGIYITQYKYVGLLNKCHLSPFANCPNLSFPFFFFLSFPFFIVRLGTSPNNSWGDV